MTEPASMAISHICLSCGMDLARLPSRPQAGYALPLVMCVNCGTTDTRHLTRRHVRSWLRLQASLITLALQVALLAVFAWAVVSVCIGVGELWVQGELDHLWTKQTLLVYLGVGVLSVFVGLWLGTAFAHAGRIRTWLVFSLVTVAMLSVDCFGEPTLRRLLDKVGLSLTLTDYRWDLLAARLTVLTAIMTMAAAGLPIAGLALAGHREFRRSRCRARRRRLRAQRTAQ